MYGSRLILGVLASGVLMAGCGAGASAPLSRSAASRLHQRFAAVETAARGGDRPAALQQLAAAGSLVDQADRAGQLTARELSALRSGIVRARERVLIEVPTAAPAATHARPPSASAPSTGTTPAGAPASGPRPVPGPGPGPDNGNGKGKGKDKGHGHGNGGD